MVNEQRDIRREVGEVNRIGRHSEIEWLTFQIHKCQPDGLELLFYFPVKVSKLVRIAICLSRIKFGEDLLKKSRETPTFNGHFDEELLRRAVCEVFAIGIH